MANIVLVDDHVLLRNGLAGLLKSLGHTVLFEADNGKRFIEKLQEKALPDIVLLDINMPEMDGYKTAKWLKQHYPEIKILALSMYDNENAIISMLKNGAKGYILKDSDPSQLKSALHDLMHKGFYYSELVSGKLMNAINHAEDRVNAFDKAALFTSKEKVFLQYTCSELTYKEIAAKMVVSPRTVDGYRDALFNKLHLKTRVGLVMYAIKNGLADLSNE